MTHRNILGLATILCFAPLAQAIAAPVAIETLSLSDREIGGVLLPNDRTARSDGAGGAVLNTFLDSPDGTFAGEGIVRVTPQGLERLVSAGEPVTVGGLSGTFQGIEQVVGVDASSGDVIFVGRLETTSNDARFGAPEGVYRLAADGTLTEVVEVAAFVPGEATPTGEIVSLRQVSSAGAETVAFGGAIQTSNTGRVDALLLTDSEGQAVILAREDASLAALPGENVAFLGSINGTGDGAAIFSVAVSDTQDGSLETVFLRGRADGTSEELFRTGEALNDVESETLLGTSGGATDNAGNFLFEGITSDRDGLFIRQEDGTIEALIEIGADLGLPDGAVLQPSIGNFAAAGDGAAAFVGSLTDVDREFGNDRALFAIDEQGDLSLILREGDLFEVADGDLRTVTALFVAAGALAANGDLVFGAFFDDGTRGLFLTNVFAAPVPLPGAALLFASVAACGFRCRSLRS